MAELAELVLAVNTKQFEKAQDILKQFQVEAGKTESATEKLASSNITLASAFKAAAGALALFKLGDLIKDSAMLAARFETMGIVMKIAGNNAGYTQAKMEEFSKGLQKSGISMLESRNVLTQLATAQVNLTKAAELGRAAQDLAVVANVNSSEALSRMTLAIKSNSVEVLQTLGLQVSFEQGYKKMADQLGTTSDKLTENQRVLARTNATLEAAAGYAGIYEEAMTTAGKAMTSLARYWENLKIKMGDAFLPALAESVFRLTDALKAANDEVDKLGSDKTISTVGTVLKEAFVVVAQTVLVLGANVLYVFQSIILEISTIYQQAKAFLTLDWSKIGEIRKAAQAEAAAGRTWVDTFSERMVGGAPEQIGPPQPRVQVDEATRIANAAKAAAIKLTDEQNMKSKAFIESLKKETLGLTQNALQQHQANIAKQVAAAATPEMAAAIQKEGDAWVAAYKKKEAANSSATKAGAAQLKHSQEYLEKLKEEQTQVGLNSSQLKMLAAAKEAAKAPTAALRLAIMTEALALVQATEAEDQRKDALEKTTAAKEKAIISSEKFKDQQLLDIENADKVVAAAAKEYASAYKMVDSLRALEIQQLETAAAAYELKAALEDPGADPAIVDRYMLAAEKYRTAIRLKQLAWSKEDIDKNTADWNKTLEANSKASGKSAAEMSETLFKSLTDSLFRAAESGKNFFQTLKESIKGIFNNFAIKIPMQMLMGAAGQVATGAAGALGLGGAGGVGGLLGNLGSLYSAASTGGSILGSSGAYGVMTGTSGAQAAMLAEQTAGFGYQGLMATSAAAQGVTVTAAVEAGVASGIEGAAALAIGSETGAVAGVASAATTTTAAGGAGLYGALSAIPVWGWVAMAAVAVAAIFGGKGGGPKSGGSAIVGGNGEDRLFTPSDSDTKIKTALASTINLVDAISTKVGGSAYKGMSTIGFDIDPQGKSQARVASRVESATGRVVYDNSAGRDVGRDMEDVTREFGIEMKRVLLGSLQASDLKQGFSEFFNRLDIQTATPEEIDNLVALGQTLIQVGDNAKYLPGMMGAIANSSAQARERLLNLVGGIDALNAAQSSYYNGFFTAEERVGQAKISMSDSFKGVGLSFQALLDDPAGPRQAFRGLVESLKDGSGNISEANMVTYAALIKLAGPLAQYLDAAAQLPGATQALANTATEWVALTNTIGQFREMSGESMGPTLPPGMVGNVNAVTEALYPLDDILNEVLGTLTSELSDLQRGMSAIAPAAETAGEKMVRMASEVKQLEAALAAAVGGGAETNMQRLTRMINTRQVFGNAIEDVQNTRSDYELQGFQNRGDTGGAVKLLKEWEANLWGGLGTSLNPAKDIAKIKEVFLKRIGIEASDAQNTADRANKKAYDDAVRTADLEKQARTDRIAALQEEISNAKQLRQIGEGLRRTVADLRIGALSSLNPQEQLRAAATEFDRVLLKAKGGDKEALSQLGAAGTTYVQEQRSFSASTGDTPAVFNRVVSTLEDMGISLAAVDIPQAQLDTLVAIKDPIITLAQTTVDYSGQAIAGLTAIDTALQAGYNYLTDEIATTTASVESEIRGMREDMQVEYQKAQTRTIQLGVDIGHLKTLLSNVNESTQGVTAAVRTALLTPPVTT